MCADASASNDSGQASASTQEFSEYLELLADIGQDFATSLDWTTTLDRALSRVATHMQAEAASLFLLDSDDRELVCRACWGSHDIIGMRIAADCGIVGRSVASDNCQLVRDVREDPDFAQQVDLQTGFVTRSVLCAPLTVGQRRIGALELINKRGGNGLFSEQDRNGLQVLAASAALALSNARLTERLIEQEKLRRELFLAGEIQRGLLPTLDGETSPVAAINVPARAVSGDFYDAFTLADGRIAFNIGDVAGKGMNAALLMAKTISLYRCLGKTEYDPSTLLQRINAELCETGTRGMFVTMIGGLYDPASDLVVFANAGHQPPMLHTADGEFRLFPASAPPLGIGEGLVSRDPPPVESLVLDGGSFVAFTDGITEARGDGTEMLGVGGVQNLLRRHAQLGLWEQIVAVIEHARHGALELHDDLTMLGIVSSR